MKTIYLYEFKELAKDAREVATKQIVESRECMKEVLNKKLRNMFPNSTITMREVDDGSVYPYALDGTFIIKDLVARINDDKFLELLKRANISLEGKIEYYFYEGDGLPNHCLSTTIRDFECRKIILNYIHKLHMRLLDKYLENNVSQKDIEKYCEWKQLCFLENGRILNI